MMFATTGDGRRVVLSNDGTWKLSDLLTPTPAGGSSDKGRFRGVPWGSSKSVVKSIERAPIEFEEDALITFKVQLLDIECLAVYRFDEDSLFMTKYLVTHEHSYSNAYLSDFSQIKEALISKYGDPSKDDTYWANDLYRDEYDDWGLAIEVGHLSMFSSWSLPDMTVLLGLSGDNYEISLSAEYYGNGYYKRFKEKARRADLDLFQLPETLRLNGGHVDDKLHLSSFKTTWIPCPSRHRSSQVQTSSP